MPNEIELNENNFLLYAAKNYENPSCYDMEEFEDDLNRIKYLKRLFKKYDRYGELKERLILNHIIVLYNVFGTEPCTKILKYKLTDYLQYLKPFLLYLNCWDIENDGIIMDTEIINRLRKI